MFFRKKRLVDCDPGTLSLEVLSTLQGSLIAKLILVNTELRNRYRNIVELSEGLENGERSRDTLAKGADHLEKINVMLEAELARIKKPTDQSPT